MLSFSFIFENNYQPGTYEHSRAAWVNSNPGKTEQDYDNMLSSYAKSNALEKPAIDPIDLISFGSIGAGAIKNTLQNVTNTFLKKIPQYWFRDDVVKPAIAAVAADQTAENIIDGDI